MQMMLEERDLCEVDCLTVLDQATYKWKSRKAMSAIGLSMEDLQQLASEAIDAWSKMEDHFEKKSLANKLFNVSVSLQLW